MPFESRIILSPKKRPRPSAQFTFRVIRRLYARKTRGSNRRRAGLLPANGLASMGAAMAEDACRICGALPRLLLRDLRGRNAEILRLIEKFVRVESPSLDKSAVDRFGKIVAAEWSRRGAEVTRLPQKQRGDHLCYACQWGSGATVLRPDPPARPSRHRLRPRHLRAHAIPRFARTRLGAGHF